MRIGLRHEIGEALEAGTGVVIAVVYPNGRAPVENTLYRATKITTLRMDKSTVNTLEDAVAKAMTEIGHPISTGTTDTSSVTRSPVASEDSARWIGVPQRRHGSPARP